MSLLFRTVFATAATSTHHKLALDALAHLQEADAERWQRLFLKYYEPYLKGAKAPDTEFKDFKNHVLHVEDNYWGGAIKAAHDWYGRLLIALRAEAWDEAAYAAGVLTHYYSDPLMPFHTGQSEEEGKVHRAAEWSTACAYTELRTLIEQSGGYPDLQVNHLPDWLEVLIKDGAGVAHPHYRPLIDQYDLKKGLKDPPAGLNRDCRQRIAKCLAHATIGIARILEQAFYEADVRPPAVSLTLESFLATLAVPVRWITKKMADAEDREIVERIYAEIARTGKAIESLPEDERTVRRLHAEEVLGISEADLNRQKVTPSVKPGRTTVAAPIKVTTTARAASTITAKPAPTAKPASATPIVSRPATAAMPQRSTITPAAQRDTTVPPRRPSVATPAIKLGGGAGAATTKTDAVPPVANPAPVVLKSSAAASAPSLSNVKPQVAALPPATTKVSPAPVVLKLAQPPAVPPLSPVVDTPFLSELDEYFATLPDAAPIATATREPIRLVDPPSTRRPTAPAAITIGERRQPVTATSPEPNAPPAIRLASVPAAAQSHAADSPRETRSAKSPVELKFYLEKRSRLEDAPSIGASLAKRFEAIGVRTVAELLTLDPDKAARKLSYRRLDAATIRDYQAQAILCCRIPKLRGHDAQILVACDLTDPEEIARFQPTELLSRLTPFLETNEAERLLRGSAVPDLDEVTDWIHWARNARPLQAA